MASPDVFSVRHTTVDKLALITAGPVPDPIPFIDEATATSPETRSKRPRG